MTADQFINAFRFLFSRNREMTVEIRGRIGDLLLFEPIDEDPAPAPVVLPSEDLFQLIAWVKQDPVNRGISIDLTADGSVLTIWMSEKKGTEKRSIYQASIFDENDAVQTMEHISANVRALLRHLKGNRSLWN